ncbi:MAG: hypothetical protein R3336_05440 [Phycisphaeraceae bacterium]|nr:hypothetical protein [Phycisphaeraceae bacterium]
MIAFIDTHTLIGWIRESGEKDKVGVAAQKLMDNLERQKADVVVSTGSVVAFLNALPESERQIQIALLEQCLIVHPFDAHAAQVANGLSKQAGELDAYDGDKDRLKAHLRLVGTARASGSEVLYSPDGDLRKLAELAGLTAKNLAS